MLGRGFDNRAANHVFGMQGRTSAQKTATTVDDVLAIEEGIQEQLNELKKQLQVIKDHAGHAWFHSARRTEIMADWSWQRKHNK